jgi:hypothetical protein
MQAILLDVDGSHAVQGETQFSPETATAEAEQLALSLLAQGGSEIKQRILAAGIVS